MMRKICTTGLIVIGIVLMTSISINAGVTFTQHLIDGNLPYAFSVFAKDVDGNGTIDIVAGGHEGRVVLYKNNGSGSFTKIIIDYNFGSTWSVYATDVDGDGRVDILAAASGIHQVAWWKNNGGTSFTKKIIDDNLIDAEDVSAGDLDGDGDVDIVAVGWSDVDPAVWYENLGNQNFRKHIFDANFSWAHSVCVADFNGDGRLDIAGATGGTRIVDWWKNNGDGSFSARTVETKFCGVYCVEGIDIDRDGDKDILGAANCSDQVAWWKNSGSGTFTKYIIDYNFVETSAATAGDMDGDGDIDILAVSKGSSEVAWWENNGNQSFTKHSISTNVAVPKSITVGDLDGDGDLDVVSVSRTNHDVIWWENGSAIEVVSNPSRPTGPATGIVDEVLTYSTGGSTSSFGDAVEYQFDWGDGEQSAWGAATKDHFYSAVGTYQIKARARCQSHTTIVSGWSSSLSVTIQAETVSAPSRPAGPDSGIVNQNLSYSTGGATSSYGHAVEYQFDWGDGQQSAWGDGSKSHFYSTTGVFLVRARARCQLHTDIVSAWSSGQSVTITPNEYEVSGIVSYYSNSVPVTNVLVNVTGEVSASRTTNTTGAYTFVAGAGKSFTIIPAKTKGEDIGPFDISTYDAALTARFALGLEQLDSTQQIAADADKNGIILTFDAALIARYAVGLEPFPSSFVSEWLFIPDSCKIQKINSHHNAENFTAIIIGNVHGGWAQPGNLGKIQHITTGKGKLGDVIVENNEMTVPIYAEAGQEILSADIDLHYDRKNMEFLRVEKTALSNDFQLFCNDEGGRLRVGMYAVKPLNQSGVLVKLIFKRNRLVSGSTVFRINKFQLNDEVIISGKTDVSLSGGVSKDIDYALHQNYPNPFNSSTMISYQVAKSGYGSLKIYNLFGQEVRTLVDGIIQQGHHQIIWDGKNNEGQSVAGGVYFYQLKMGDFIAKKKMLVLE